MQTTAAPNLRLHVEPGVTIDGGERKRYPRQSIFLDGFHAGPPFFDNEARQYSFDHHEGCVRAFTVATCEQAVIAVREGPGRYWCPNGNHRLEALRALGARAVTALVLPDREVAFRILALNTEKAHALREKSLEVSRMEAALATERPGRREADFAFEFESPFLLTLGIAYAGKPRFSGGAYRGILRRVDGFLDQ